MEQRVVTLIVDCAKLTDQELRKALAKLLEKMKAAKLEKQIPHGKMTVKQLAAQNKGMQSIEVSSSEICSFNRIARKYGIDFAPFKVKGEDRHLIFFKAPDTDAMTAAFKEYSNQQLNKKQRPSVLGKLAAIKALLASVTVDRVKRKELER